VGAAARARASRASSSRAAGSGNSGIDSNRHHHGGMASAMDSSGSGRDGSLHRLQAMGRGSSGIGAGSSNTAGRVGAASNQANDDNDHDDNDDDDEVQVVNSNGETMDDDEDMEFHYDDNEEEDDFDDDGGGREDYDDDDYDADPIVASDYSTGINRNHAYSSTAQQPPPSLSTMFAPPTHLMHRAGGFLGARNFAKDARRWLLVNIQSDADFACHALNRDVWRDELVENLVREGFILWQAVSFCHESFCFGPALLFQSVSSTRSSSSSTSAMPFLPNNERT
jgi:hypothetical protein